MAVDKLVDSTQLDADLTSVANAIRTKGGTSASLAFPADFVSAIAAISGGGGATAVTGEVTVASEIASPGSSASKSLPGITLDFVPDFFYFAMTSDTFDSLGTYNSTQTLYMVFYIKKEWLPRLQTSSTTNDSTLNITHRVFPINALYNNNSTNWSINGKTTIDATRYQYWKIEDGYVKYGRSNNSAGTKILPGKYRYFAIKF